MSQVEYDVDQDDTEGDKDETQYVAVEGDSDTDLESDGDSEDDTEDQDADAEEEQRLGGGRDDDDDDDDPDSKKARRRSENKSRRQRQREARDRTDRELTFLRSRNEQLERRFTDFEQQTDARIAGSEVAAVDTQINKAKSDMQLANQVIEQAVEANDGKNLAEALDHRDAIRDNLRDLEQAKTYLSQERPPAPAQELDPRHVAHAQSFMVDHSWWDPRGGDQDSQQVLSIDRALVTEGFNPQSKEYWDELRERVETALPNHFDSGSSDKDDDDTANTKGGDRRSSGQRNKGPQFRTGGRERSLKKNEVYISPERREAMEEAGVWSDPVLRNKYLASYAKYDQENGKGA